jgi:hypothetical protein
MPYWIYGKDGKTGQPTEMLSDADTPEAAREQATAQGITAERVVPAGAAKPAESLEGPVLDTSWPGEAVGGQPGPQYEFTVEQNRVIGDLAGKMRFVGLFLILGGVLECLSVLRGDLGHLIAGVVFILFGVWTRGAAGSFRKIVDTEGRDITHLMRALGELRQMYTLQYWLLMIAIALILVVLLVAFFGALVFFMATGHSR